MEEVINRIIENKQLILFLLLIFFIGVYIKLSWVTIKYKFNNIIEYFKKIHTWYTKLDDRVKRLIIAMEIIAISFTLALWIGSQIFAKHLNYNLYFTPMFTIKGYPIYFPLSCLVWYLDLSKISDYRIIFAMKKSLNAFFNTLLFISLGLSVGVYFKREKLTSHGTSRWITTKELFKSGYLHKGKEPYPDGVILGRDEKGNTVIDNEKTHISVIAPTRSGKGVGVIVPTLLNWQGSTLTFDPKGENYELTSGYRKSLDQIILKFCPYQKESISYNPLSEIRIKTMYEFRDAQIIADILTEPGEGKQRDHWDLSASTFLVGMILKTLYDNPRAGLGDVVDFLTDPSAPLDNRLTRILEEEHTDDENLFNEIYGSPVGTLRHPKIAQTVSEILNKPDKERGSVISSALSKLTLFKDPIVRNNTTRVDFRIEDLMFHKKPVNLYCVFEPEAIKPLSSIMVMLVTQVIGRLTRDLEEKGRNNRLLLMLDELPAFGKIDLLEKGLAYIAGYKIKAVLIGQSLNQLDKTYGEKNSVLDNCNTSVFYAPNPNDDKTPKLISEKLGNQTIEVSSLQNKQFSFENLTITRNKQARALMTPEEIRTLPENRNIVFFGGYAPLKGVKIKYYQEPYFVDKTKLYKIPPLETMYGSIEDSIKVAKKEKEKYEQLLLERDIKRAEDLFELYLQYREYLSIYEKYGPDSDEMKGKIQKLKEFHRTISDETPRVKNFLEKKYVKRQEEIKLAEEERVRRFKEKEEQRKREKENQEMVEVKKSSDMTDEEIENSISEIIKN